MRIFSQETQFSLVFYRDCGIICFRDASVSLIRFATFNPAAHLLTSIIGQAMGEVIFRFFGFVRLLQFFRSFFAFVI